MLEREFLSKHKLEELREKGLKGIRAVRYPLSCYHVCVIAVGIGKEKKERRP
jgi:hypothetical protein